MKDKLQELRDKIDDVDLQLLKLLGERAEYASETRLHKQKLGTTADGVYDPEREKHVIERLLNRNNSKLSDLAVSHIFQTVIGECRCIQKQSGSEKAIISLQGDHGSFSEQAAINFVTKHIRRPYELRYDLTPGGVVDSLLSRSADYGVMAVNNAWGGLVEDSIAALAAHRYRIIDMMPMPVLQCLLCAPDQDPKTIKKIISHPQALRQCRDYITEHYPQAALIEYADTALAARDCASGQLGEDVAVIASENCVEAFSMKLIDRSIQDLDDNDTLFIAISRFD